MSDIAAHPIEQLAWLLATYGVIYLLLASVPLRPLRWLVWRLLGRTRLMRVVIYHAYCPVCASPWVGALLGYALLGHHGAVALLLDAAIALGAAVIRPATFAATDSWIHEWEVTYFAPPPEPTHSDESKA